MRFETHLRAGGGKKLKKRNPVTLYDCDRLMNNDDHVKDNVAALQNTTSS
jgi:hypothetical protein